MPPSPQLASWNGHHWEVSHTLPVTPTDRGLLHGLGLFETLLATHRQPRFISWHLERLRLSASRLHWNQPSPSEADWRFGIERLFETTDLNNETYRIRLTLTAGSGRLTDLTPGLDATALISLAPLDPAPQSLAVMISPWTRNANCPLAGVKTTSYAANLVALDHARRQGFHEILFLNQHGDLCEAATANLFLFLDGRWHTPPVTPGCLPGICRRWLLENGATETHLTPDDLARAEAVILTSSTRGPTPVHQIDNRQIPPHPAAATLRQSWHAAVGIVPQ